MCDISLSQYFYGHVLINQYRNATQLILLLSLPKKKKKIILLVSLVVKYSYKIHASTSATFL